MFSLRRFLRVITGTALARQVLEPAFDSFWQSARRSQPGTSEINPVPLAAPTDQLAALSTAQIAALLPQALNAYDSPQFAQLSSAQVAALTSLQLRQLETADLAAIGTGALQGLSSARIPALSTDAVVALGTAQFAALGSEIGRAHV